MFKLAPFVGIACPGVTNSDGSMRRALRTYRQLGQHRYNLPASVVEPSRRSGSTIWPCNAQRWRGGAVRGSIHEDVNAGACLRWTGVGNARFTNRNGKGER